MPIRILKKNRVFLTYVTLGVPIGFLKKFSQFNSAVWTAIAYIYIRAKKELYYKLAQGPALPVEKKIWTKKILNKKFRFFSLKHPQATHECPEKNPAQSVQLFGLAMLVKIFFSIFLALDTLRPAMNVHKKFQLIRFSRLVSYRQHIYTNVLFYYIEI